MVSNIHPSKEIELDEHEMRRFVVNGQRLKHYNFSGLEAAMAESLCFNDAK